MKAITLWQPWASLLACGAKRFETRSWATAYRGIIAIHAAAKHINAVIPLISREAWSRIYDLLHEDFGVYTDADNTLALPTGTIVATAELAECYRILHVHIPPERPEPEEYCVDVDYNGRLREIWITGDELLFGDWTPGRYAWGIANIKVLDEPIPAKGKQGLWNWESGQ